MTLFKLTSLPFSQYFGNKLLHANDRCAFIVKTQCQIASTKAKVNQRMHYHSAMITLIKNIQENMSNFT